MEKNRQVIRQEGEEASFLGVPDELIQDILLMFNIKEVQRLLMLNTQWMKQSYIWTTLYDKRFKHRPYWFDKEMQKRGWQGTEKEWPVYKNLYSWMHEALENIFKMSDYTTSFTMMGDKARKVEKNGRDYYELIGNDDGGGEDWGVNLRFDKDLKDVGIIDGHNAFTYSQTQSHFRIAYQAQIEPLPPSFLVPGDLVFHTKDNSIEFNKTEEELIKIAFFSRKNVTSFPIFLSSLRDDTKFNWNTGMNRLEMLSVPSLNVMMLNLFNVMKVYSDYTISTHYKMLLETDLKLWKDIGTEHVKSFPEFTSGEYFVFFIMSLFAIEEQDLVLAKSTLISLENDSIENLITELLIKVIFDSLVLPLKIKRLA